MSLASIARRALLTLAASLALAGCGKREAQEEAAARHPEYEQLELRYQGFSGQVTFPELAEDLGYLAPVKLKFVGSTISGPQDIQTVVTGDTDYGGAFNGAVVKLIAAGAPVKSVIGYYGVSQQTWSGFFVLEDSPIRTARDLIGKKVSVNTVGAHHEFILREYLARNGLTPEEAKQVTLVAVPPVSSEQSLRQKQVEVATLSGILREKALERGGIRKLFSDFDLYGEFTAGSYVMKKDFMAKNPKTTTKFVEATARAIEWARSQPREVVVARFDAIVKRRGRTEDASALKYWRDTGVAGKGGLIRDREFQVWIDWLVKAGELRPGQVDPKALYTNEFNPFQKDPT